MLVRVREPNGPTWHQRARGRSTSGDAEGHEGQIAVAADVLDPASPHHLTGLYTWTKDKSGTKLKWIQALIELVRKQTETGVKSIQTNLEDIAAGRLSLGVEESGNILQPRLEELLYRGYESLSEHQEYMDWVKGYRESQGRGEVEVQDK